MAVTNSIPPQAYTRDVLVKAIEWAQSQPQSLREKATTADLLVSFYMQACRRAAASNEAPVSQENFKQDLKHLAEGLRQFEEPVAPPTHQPGRFPSYGETVGVVEPIFPHVEMGPQRNQYLHQHQQQTHVHVHAPQPVAQPVAPPPPQAPPPPVQQPRTSSGMQWTVDAKSLAIARDVQQRLNLSNETEALRMLITFGAQKARDLFGS